LTTRSGIGLRATLGTLAEDTRDLAARLDVQTAFLPKQVRWQAEYLLLEALTDPVWRKTPPVSMVAGVTERLVRVAEQLPLLVDRNVTASFGMVTRERKELERFVSSERVATMGELKGMLANERSAVLRDVRGLGDAWLGMAADRASAMIDRIFYRLLLLLGLLLAGGLIIVQVVLSQARRRRSLASSHT
jgi:hypothetical protein